MAEPIHLRRGRRPTRRKRWTVAGLASGLVLGSVVVGTPAALASFVDDSVAATATLGAAPDWVAPQVSTSVVAKDVGYLTGSIKQGGSYYVYANVTDTGNPASGIALTGEQADMSAVTAAGATTALVAGTYSAGGQTYNYRSASLLALNPLAAGAKAYSITSTDVAGNSRFQSGYSLTVDNTIPVAADVQTANVSGGTAGRAQAGDSITFTYSEQVDPESVSSGWTGPSVSVVVRLIDGGCLLNLLVTVCNDDTVEVYDATNVAKLPLGSVNLERGDFYGTLLGTLDPMTFGASGTPSTMVQSGSAITVTLGTASATADTAQGSAAMTWTPAGTAYDAAGNLSSTTTATESGTADRDF